MAKLNRDLLIKAAEKVAENSVDDVIQEKEIHVPSLSKILGIPKKDCNLLLRDCADLTSMMRRDLAIHNTGGDLILSSIVTYVCDLEGNHIFEGLPLEFLQKLPQDLAVQVLNFVAGLKDDDEIITEKKSKP